LAIRTVLPSSFITSPPEEEVLAAGAGQNKSPVWYESSLARLILVNDPVHDPIPVPIVLAIVVFDVKDHKVPAARTVIDLFSPFRTSVTLVTTGTASVLYRQLSLAHPTLIVRLVCAGIGVS